MAGASKPTLVENINVLQVGKFGVRVDEKTWFGVNEPLTPSNFVPNEGYKVSVTVSKTGKKYINAILGVEAKESAPAPAPVAQAAAPAAAPAKAATPKDTTPVGTSNPVRAGFGNPLTAYDLAIQRQISRAGIYQAALGSPAMAQWATSPDEYLALVRKAADAGMQYVNE